MCPYRIPDPEKAETGGEDAFFVCETAGGGALGVADGVGSYAAFGLNAKMFADELMGGCQQAATIALTDTATPTSSGADDGGASAGVNAEAAGAYLSEIAQLAPAQVARRLLQYGYSCTRSIGASTALTAHLDRASGRLGVANLGDSGMIVLRRHEKGRMTVLLRTKEQQHEWKMPFQLARSPDESNRDALEKDMKELVRQLREGKRLGVVPDKPEDAQLYTVALREGDLLILGTDGVFDNLFDDELCGIADLTLSPSESLVLNDPSLATPARSVAAAIAEAARHRSMDPHCKTPFAKTARQNNTHHTGGKLDDVTTHRPTPSSGAGGGETVAVKEGTCRPREAYLQEIQRVDLPPEEIALRILQYGYIYVHPCLWLITALVVVYLDKKGETLAVANLGDSKMILLRRQKNQRMTVPHHQRAAALLELPVPTL
ncbi:unnamed protein product [Vitrella brassicaformis CCMP3155]|uniref:Protein phosphatase n=1 Tax=Vitrella brassicaformis (strain CCMP3155) TaxID=1169540 RepID=A0A0G4FYW2_VITBC|nr:unnamed protein product [Vitrella brassicaformis CCMP3155]|eukprot:CEM20273.1 unnamed protein product [Vitrella brassicaformis CCMP3155]